MSAGLAFLTHLAADHSQDPPPDLSWLWGGLVGVGGFIIGGWFVLVAGKQQYKRDLEATRTDRSHMAAIAIAGEALRMQDAVDVWRTSHDANALSTAQAAYSRAAIVQVLAITDPDVIDRVADHTVLTRRLADAARTGGPAANDLALTLDRHSDALVMLLNAHVRGWQLPTYPRLPLSDPKAMRSWST
jgi:hypothetical protein